MKHVKIFEEFMNEKKKVYDYGCAMLYFDFPGMENLHKQIEADDVFVDPKDATFGLETFHPEAKKAIGKGLDNERQFAAIRELKRYKPVYTYTGMICGLPGEPLSSVYNSQKILLEQNFEVFDNWDWWPLVIRKNSVSRLSEFGRS
jgi:radical SAM superfamily enzyme